MRKMMKGDHGSNGAVKAPGTVPIYQNFPVIALGQLLSGKRRTKIHVALMHQSQGIVPDAIANPVVRWTAAQTMANGPGTIFAEAHQ